jgi:hypothetical protein
MNGDTPGGEPGLKGNGPSGLDPEELRARLQSAVRDVRPREGTLEYLRWAVPVRRRRRAVVVASSATLVFVSAVVIVVGSQLGLVPHGSGSAGSALTVNGAGAQSSGDAGGLNQGDAATHSRDDTPGSQHSGTASASVSGGPATPGTTPPTATSPGSTGTATPGCTAGSFSSIGFGPTVAKNGITYGVVTGTADTACVFTGPPTVALSAVTAGAPSVTTAADDTGAEGLPDVPTWGAKFTLASGQSFQFQFAWVPTTCQTSSPTPTGTSTGTGTSTATTSGNPTSSPTSTYTLSQVMGGTSVASLSTLSATCGATVYYTDAYRAGAYSAVSAG